MLLTQNEITSALSSLRGWKHIGNSMEKKLVFDDFIEAMKFINTVAVVAQEAKHHPEWCNVYNKVTITLTTHDAGGITQKDIDLAKGIDLLEDKN